MTINFDAIRALGGPLFIIFWGMVVLLLDLGKTGEARRRALPVISIFGVIVAAFLSVTSVSTTLHASDVSLTGAATFFGGGMISDWFGALFCLVLCIVAALAILMSDKYLAEKGINQGEFYALILFSASGAMLMALSYDLVNVFVGLEILSVALYILSGFARRERRSEEAAVKYFLLGAFASGFLLYGIALIYGSVGFVTKDPAFVSNQTAIGAGYTNLDVIRQALEATQSSINPLLMSPVFIAGVALVIVGLGFKAAIVPFHSYAPDVYEGAPTPVTAFMSVAAKIGAFAALMRLLQVMASTGSIGPFHNVLWGLAVATMVVGNVLAIRQSNIKRMLAYSSIAHAGYILVGVLASTSLQPAAAELAQNAIRYYLFAYTFMNLGAFAVVIWLGQTNSGDYLNIRDYDGLGKRQPLAAAAMSVIMLSLAGVPPTVGFVGKLYLFMSAFQAGEPVLATIGLVVSAIGVFYYLSLIVAMYFREPHNAFDNVRSGKAKLAALLCTLAILIFGVAPQISGAFAPTSVDTNGNAATQTRRGGRQRRDGRRRRPAPGAPTAVPDGASSTLPAPMLAPASMRPIQAPTTAQPGTLAAPAALEALPSAAASPVAPGDASGAGDAVSATPAPSPSDTTMPSPLMAPATGGNPGPSPAPPASRP